ncbi:protein irg-1-like [Glandiceps talaboti]
MKLLTLTLQHRTCGLVTACICFSTCVFWSSNCKSTTSMRTKTAKAKSSSSVQNTKSEKYTFFWKIQSPFSQWFPANFTVDGITYSCAEQYMMHQKAVMFGDREMAKKIMKTNKPKAMKAFGRKVQNFEVQTWNERCKDVVKKANMAKFSQNSELKAKLFATVGTTLVEASPRDRIWGIGLGAANPKAQRKATWRGKNLLGYILTDVRDELMATDNTTVTTSDESSDTQTE